MFKYLAIIIGVLAVSLAAFSNPSDSGVRPEKLPVKEVPKVFLKTPTHPDTYCIMALAYLKGLPADYQPFIRFFPFYYTPDELLEERKTLFTLYVNKVSLGGSIIKPIEVPNSNGRLFAIDLRDAKWNIIGFSAVARRDFVFREPNIDISLAQSLRALALIVQDPLTFHCETIVPAEWFMRDSSETDRSTSYYDLLYGNERFGKFVLGQQVQIVPEKNLEEKLEELEPKPQPPGEVSWEGGIWAEDGKHYPAGSFKYTKKEHLKKYQEDLKSWEENKILREEKKKLPVKNIKVENNLSVQNVLDTKVKVDFPKNVKEWDKKWGVTAVEDFLKDEKIVIKNGEVVAGAKSDPHRGSYVSYNDRIITFLPVPTGTSMRTYDSLKTAMKKNYANFPEEASIGDVPFDAGELLVNLPNGLQAAMLINGVGDRVEFGDSRAVRNTVDGFDVTVKTYVACVTCHAPQYGVLSPSNHKVKEAIKNGNAVITKDKIVKERLDKFFEEWDDKLEIWRDPYKRALKKATKSEKEPNGWTGQKFASANVEFRNWYDHPLSLDQASAELGIPRLATILICLSEGSIDAGNLVLDGKVPRDVWEADLFPRLSLIFAAYRDLESPNELLKQFYPELLRQVQFDKKKVK